MPLEFDYTPGLGSSAIYALFSDGSTAVAMLEGSSLLQGHYTTADSVIQGAGLAAGTYSARIYLGTAASPSVSDELVGQIKRVVWDGANVVDELAVIDTNVDAINAGNAGLMQSTTIATLTSQTVGTLTAGSADDDAYNGHAVIITNQSTSTQKWAGVIEDYVGATKTFTLRAAPGFTIAAGDSIAILASQDGNVLDLISQTQNSITFSPDRDRTWVVRRNSTSKTITKRTDETAVFYVDCSKLMGSGEFLAAADTFSVNVNDSGCTVASGYPTKESGTIIGVKLSGGTSSDSAYTLDVEFQTDQGSEPIEASVKLLVVASETE